MLNFLLLNYIMEHIESYDREHRRPVLDIGIKFAPPSSRCLGLPCCRLVPSGVQFVLIFGHRSSSMRQMCPAQYRFSLHGF